MDIRQIRYFIAVAEELNMGRAAERLHLSAPPLTRQIQALEDELGVLLFRRTPHGVTLTEAGGALLKDALNIKNLVDQATERTRRAARGQIGTLDVGVFGSAMLEIVPAILSSFSQSHPDVVTLLHTAQTALQIQAVLQGKVLLAFDRFVPSVPELVVEKVAREPMVVALHKRNPLAAKRCISIRDLASEKMVVGASARSNLADKTMALFSAHDIEPNIAQQVSDVISGAAVIASGLGTGLMPASVKNLSLPNLVFRPLRAEGDAFFELYCFYRRDEQSPLLKALLEVVRAYRLANEQAESLDPAPK